MEFVYIISIFIILVSVYMFIQNKNTEVTYVVSKIDNKKYLVQNQPDKQEAADLLANVKLSLMKVCQHLKDKYPQRDDIKRLNEKFNPDVIVEAEPNSKSTSYSINKGEKIVLCLRSRDEERKLVDHNIMMFVSLHELAHIMTKSVGHTDEFWKNFQFLLKEAVEMGMYKDVDFKKNPTEYCGVTITDSPLHN